MTADESGHVPERRRSVRQDPAGLGRRLASLEVVICSGSGGVGKTTVSAALGIAIAAAEDKRVLVLTVDPAGTPQLASAARASYPNLVAEVAVAIAAAAADGAWP